MIDYVLAPTQEGELRRRALFWLPAPLPVLGVVYLLVGGQLAAAGWTILLAASVGVGTMLLALVVQPTPLPEGLVPQVSARRSLHRFRQFTGLRITLALVPVVIGAAASVIGGGLYPLFAALALAWPQLLLALPTFFTITRARRAMEAWGTTAYLWHALSRPARVTWPVLTPAARNWRAWRAENARQDRRKSEEEKAWKEAVREESEQAGGTAADPAATERTRPIRPVDQEATDVLPHLDSGRPKAPSDADGEKPTEVLPHLGAASGDGESGREVRPTRAMPHLDGDAEAGDDGEDGARAEAAPARTPRGTVNRARHILEQGSGALGLSVRRPRRGAQSSRRPTPNKP
ncbi:MFS transporter [Nocardiopsis dassonvillei]|uniref:hypothetical protein n=1 Tax=Nocardiopsis dassonvillei TaxID=2014 RepID=UPI000B9D7DAD|nr:hypothetical protein [Nocardiopsis dassonvillei]ASU59388.1 hypothetical protein CGQ36_18265 [Nocardiopsis dassonvillei]